MDEPLLGEGPLSVDVDREARLATVRTQRPGPAGTAGLDLGGALELDIDLARPATLAGLTIELPTTGDAGRLPRSARRRLDALLGAARAEQVAASVRAAGETIGGEPLSLGGGGGGGGGGSAGVAPALQRAALAHAAASEAAAPLSVRAAGLIEAAVALDPVASRGLLDLRATAHHDAQAGVDLLVRLAGRGSLAVPGAHAATALAGLVREVRPLVDDSAARALVTLAEEIERGRHTVPVAPVGHAGRSGQVGPPPVPSSSTVARLVRRTRVDVFALPGALADAAVAAHRSTSSEIEVRITGWADRRHGLWARAFDAADDTLIGLAPFGRDPEVATDAVARLLVPSDSGRHGQRRFEVDVTDRPEMPRPSPTLAVVERARHHGAVAARADRLGDRVQARHRWLTCARSWAAAGDPVRAEQARALAAGRSSPGEADGFGAGAPAQGIGPLVCDLVSAY